MTKVRGGVVSVIMAGRDDDYGNQANKGIRNLTFTPVPYLERLANTVKKFDNGFKEIGVTAEIIIVDWSPTKFLFENPIIEKICIGRNVRFVVVARSMVKKMNLNPDGFDEFFAKNVGIRSAIGEYVLLTNSDAWPDKRLFSSILIFLRSNFSTYYGRPHSRIDLDQTNKPTGEGLTFNNCHGLDGILGTAAAGDFVLTKRNNILLVGGYNETIKRKKTKTRQAGLDGQLLMNLYLQGILPKKLEGSILTFDHNKILRHDYGVPQISYINNANWGLANYSREYLSPNAVLISHLGKIKSLKYQIFLIQRNFSRAKSILKNRMKSHQPINQNK
jgi:hypothetical protein